MSTVRDRSKERYWRKLIRRQGQSGESITRFCASEGVSAHQFYWWRRTLRDRDRTAVGGGRRAASNRAASNDQQVAATFVPVRLAFSAGTPIEVVHPAGCVVRVPVGFDRDSLRGVLAALEPTPAGRAES